MLTRLVLAAVARAAALYACVLVAMLAPATASAQAACPAAPGEPPCGASDGPASLSDTTSLDVAVGNPVHPLTGAKAQTEIDAAPAPGMLGLEIRRHYSSAHAGVDGPFGAGWTLSYDTRLHRVGKTAQIIQADGRRIIFQVGGRPDAPTCTGLRPDDGELDVSIAPPGGVTGYRWRWPDGREIVFDARGYLTGIRQTGHDAVSLAVVVTRNAAGQIERVVDPHGRAMRLHHDTAGHVTRIDHPRGTWHYRVGDGGGLQSVKAPNGVVRRYEYGDPAHPFRLTAIRMSDGRSSSERVVASWSYQGDGRVAEALVSRDGDDPIFGRPSGSPARYRFDYDPDGEGATRVTTADGGWVRYRHRTIAGRIRPVTVESAVCTTCPSDHRLLDYDQAGRIIRTRWRPARAGATQARPTTDIDGMTDIRFERDGQGRVMRIVAGSRDPARDPRWIRRFEYADGPSRRPTLIARPSVERGREHRLVLTWGDTAATRDRLVRVDEHGYRDGQPIARTVHYRHDEAGQLMAIDGPLPGEENLFEVVHDPRRPGRVIGLLDPLGRPVSGPRAAALLATPAWAGLGRQPDPDPTRFQVTTGEIVHRAPNGATTRITVDDFGRTVRVASDDAGVEHLVHDEADRVVLNTDATGASATLRHDAAGRPLERVVRMPGREPEVTRYRYEPDRTVSVEHPVASEVVRHDDTGRVIERAVTLHVGPAAGMRLVRRYHYRGEERLPSAIDLPDGTRLAYGNGTDRTVRWIGHASPAAIDLWQRRQEGEGVRWNFGNGVTRRLARDANRRMVSIEDRRGNASIARRALTYDRQGRIDAIDDGQGGWHYAYDSHGRLIIAQPGRHAASEQTAPKEVVPKETVMKDATAEATSWWYAHDENGNRLLVKAPGQRLEARAGSPKPAPIDASATLPAGRPVELAYGTASDRVSGPAYDQAGRPMRWRGMDLTWHAGGRIETVVRDGQPVAWYHYNHRGERIAKQVGADWTYFDYEGGRLAGQKRHGEPGMRHIVHDGDLPAVMIDARPAADGFVSRVAGAVQALLGRTDAVRWLHLDHRGAPIATTDARGQIVWKAQLSPDGERLPDSTGPDPEDPRLRLPGQYHDAETGLHDNLHRTYDPRVGRYLSPDPLGLRAGSNPYRYAGGDPINRVDPTGLLLFAFDGTGNTEVDRTNVRLMWEAYAMQGGERVLPSGDYRHYEQGVGTTGSQLEQAYQKGTADEWKVAVDLQFGRFMEATAVLEPGDELFIDVIGFSRGAIQARVFGQRVARALRDGTIRNAGQVTLRFMGLYDAVSTNIFDGMSSQAIRCAIGIAPEWQHVTHLVAINEYRPLFQATLLGTQLASPGVRNEIALVGAHSNIGGGYNPRGADGVVASRDRSDLSDVALWVMMEEARQAGVQFRALDDEYLKVTNAVINDQTAGSGGDPYRFVHVDGQTQPLANAGVRGMTWADSRSVGAPGHRLPYWQEPPNVPPGSGPTAVGTIDMIAYCERLVGAGTLASCPP